MGAKYILKKQVLLDLLFDMFKKPLSQTVWTQIFASILKLVSNIRQLFAADNFSRRHFSDAFFLGALRVRN